MPSSIWAAGGLRDGDRVNPSVGLSDLAGIGEEIGEGVPLAMVHAATEDQPPPPWPPVQAAYTDGCRSCPRACLLIITKRIA